MVGLTVFILIVIGLIIITIIFSKHFFKIIAGLWSVFFIVLVILGVFLYFDIKELQTNFDTAEKVILLNEKGNIVAGFSIKENDDPTFFSDINTYNVAYQQQNYAKLQGSAYKLLITQKQLFDEIRYIDVIGYPVDREHAFDYIEGTTTQQKAAENIAKENNVPVERVLAQLESEFSTENEFKGYLFAKLVGASLEKEGANYIIRSYKHDKIEVYPETITFKLIEFLPQFIFDAFFEE